MGKALSVYFHSSQMPNALHSELGQALAQRAVPPKFNYITHRQAARWWKVHQTYAPLATQKMQQSWFSDFFASVSNTFVRHHRESIGLISLGCGAGNKDALLLQKTYQSDAKFKYYHAFDVSASLTLTAGATAADVANKYGHELAVTRSVGDLMKVDALEDLGDVPHAHARCFLLLGMIPNMQPVETLDKVRTWMKEKDRLIISTNLVHSDDLQQGIEGILAQYDNDLTRLWLWTFMEDMGVAADKDSIVFSIEYRKHSGIDYARIRADLFFEHDITLTYEGNQYDFIQGDKLNLFYSNRFTKSGFERLLKNQKMRVEDEDASIYENGEEGLWLIKPEL
ncbi:MAG: L-histidine N(alpha)-methyltransferase [Verrucomicrobiota bacterium]